jgi:23S rRNA (pseudouridine1915-N3)-methyltransferase
MKIQVLVIGKTEKKWLREAIEEYSNRIQKYISFEIKELPDIKNASSMPEVTRRKKEGELLLPYLQDAYIVLADEQGKEYRSVELAAWINKLMNYSGKNLVLVIGGPYGFSEEIYQRANEKISLSKMTFSHQMVRIILIEQMYRSFTILKGEPYHHE